MGYSKPEETLALILKDEGYLFLRQFKFKRDRAWRTDFIVWFPRLRNEFDKLPSPGSQLCVEVEGVTYGKGGRHQRVQGFDADCEKYAELLLLNFRLLRVTPKMVKDGRAIAYINRFFGRGIS